MAKGISKEKIITTAESLIAERGMEKFSLHALADKLQIKTASLYSHVSGMDEILTGASEDILQSFYGTQMRAIHGKKRREALWALALSEKDYAQQNPAFYSLIMNLQLSESQELREAASCIVEPVLTVLQDYKLTDVQKTHAERAFRAGVYGFVSQEQHGYFSHFSGAADDSFQFTVTAIADGIEVMEHEN